MRGVEHKCVIISAPSGSGKTTIIRSLLPLIPQLSFSISATSRPPRPTETDGVDYHFLSASQFRQKIQSGLLLEWEEVYEGRFYGTLRSEVERLQQSGKMVIFDVDVVGGLRLKEILGEQALAIFIAPPSIAELEKRLRNRQTETAETLQARVDKAHTELGFADKFDKIIVNSDLETACKETEQAILKFIQA